MNTTDSGEADKIHGNTIFIVDDHSIVREGLKQIITLEEDLEVCGEAGDAETAIKAIAIQKPGLVLIDISLETGTSGLDLVKALRKRHPSVKILVLSMHDETLYAERAIRAGARGYIMKKKAYSEIITAIRKVLSGEMYLSDGISLEIIDKILHHPQSAADSDLSPMDILSDRELEIFRLIGGGMSTSKIARKINLSINTIQSHKRHIKEKLGLKNASELIQAAVLIVKEVE